MVILVLVLLAVCTTTLKRICRHHGIKRWPSRKIKKVGHSLQKLQLVIDSVQGVSGAFEMDSLPKLASPILSGTSLFSTYKLSDQQNPSSTQCVPDLLSTEVAASKSPSSSCSQSSISNHTCTSVSEQKRNVGPGNDGVLKRVRSEAELKCLSEERAKFLPRSQSQETLGIDPKAECYLPLLKTSPEATQKKVAHRVKITYGDEKARFRMPKNWGYEDILQEIAKRFNINDMGQFDIKYLDDDSEWVLLTCDADLEECIDVAQSCGSSTIKLRIQLSNHCLRRSRAPS